MIKNNYLIAVLAGLLVFAAAPAPTGNPGGASRDLPADVPNDILQLVPEIYQTRVFSPYWLKPLPETVRLGYWAKTDPRTSCQCEAFEYGMGQIAATRPASEFPMTMKDALATPQMLWSFDALTQKVMTWKEVRDLAGIRPPDPPTGVYITLLNTGGFLPGSHPARASAKFPPGTVMILEIPLKGKSGNPYSRGVFVGCVSKMPKLKYPPDGGPPQAVGEDVNLGMAYSFWRADQSPKDWTGWAWLRREADAALQAFVLANGKAPDTLDDLESVFGKRNRSAWTPEMERIVNEYYIPRLKAALAASANPTDELAFGKPLTEVEMYPAGVFFGGSYDEIIKVLMTRHPDFRETRNWTGPGTNIRFEANGTVPGTKRKGTVGVHWWLWRDQLRLVELKLPGLSTEEWQSVLDYWTGRVSKALGKPDFATSLGPTGTPVGWRLPDGIRFQMILDRQRSTVTFQAWPPAK